MRRFIASAGLVLILVLGTAGGAVPNAMAAQGKSNLCQTSIGTPIALVFVAAALEFLPTLLNSVPGQQINASAQQNDGPGDEDNVSC